ncbi:MAG: DUF58 domain-containing protein, partial [Planctomycetes bacterium]|nr:DUF58 domain-containing protein [Planctomycetota bacterium]
YVRPLSQQRVQCSGVFLRRGTQYIMEATIKSSFPFGLMRAIKRFNVRRAIVVYPKAVPLPLRVMNRLVGGGRRGAGRSHGRGGSEDIYGLRSYRSGDVRASIHWRTSARIGKPMVIEHEELRERSFRIVVDTWVPNPLAAERAALERVVSLATGALNELSRRGLRVGLRYTNGQVNIVPEGEGIVNRHLMLGHLADLEYAESPMSDWSRRAFEDLRADDAVLLFTLQRRESLKAIAESAGCVVELLSIEAPEIVEHLLAVARANAWRDHQGGQQ